MRKLNYFRAITGLALVVLIGGGMAGCIGSGRLALRFEPGVFYSQKVRLVSDLNMPVFPGADHQESELILNLRVKEVDELGRATVKVTIRSLKARMRSLGVSCSYDSEKSSNTSSADKRKSQKALNNQKKYESSFAGLAGKSYHALVDKDGRVLELIDVDEMISKHAKKPVMNGSFGGYQSALLLSPHHLREYVSPGLLTARADKAPKVDDTWGSDDIAESPRTLPVAARKKCTIKGIEKRRNDKVAVISFTGKGIKGQELPEYARGEDKNFKEEMEIVQVEHNSGEAVFSLRQGRLLELREKLITEVRIPPERLGRNYREPTSRRIKTYYVIKKTIEFLGN